MSQLNIPGFPQASPAASIVAPVISKQSPFPPGWDEVQATDLGGEDLPIPVKPTLYARWASRRNLPMWLQQGFVKVEQSYLKEGEKFEFWDKKDQAYIRNGELIAICCPFKTWLGLMKGNYIKANGRVSSRFREFQNSKFRNGKGETSGINYIPEAKWEGPQAHFPEDEK